jgi:hypothetical protein
VNMMTTLGSIASYYQVTKDAPDFPYARKNIGFGALRRLVDYAVSYGGVKEFKVSASVGAFCALFDMLQNGTIFKSQKDYKFSVGSCANLVSNLSKLMLYSRVFSFAKGLSNTHASILETIQDVADITSATYLCKEQWKNGRWMLGLKECRKGDDSETCLDNYETAQVWHAGVDGAKIIMMGVFATACITTSICNLVLRFANLGSYITSYKSRCTALQGLGYKMLIAMTATTEVAKFALNTYKYAPKLSM